MNKHCRECDQVKPADQFYYGRRVCKLCLVALQRKHRAIKKGLDINELLRRWRCVT